MNKTAILCSCFEFYNRASPDDKPVHIDTLLSVSDKLVCGIGPGAFIWPEFSHTSSLSVIRIVYYAGSFVRPDIVAVSDINNAVTLAVAEKSHDKGGVYTYYLSFIIIYNNIYYM